MDETPIYLNSTLRLLVYILDLCSQYYAQNVVKKLTAVWANLPMSFTSLRNSDSKPLLWRICKASEQASLNHIRYHRGSGLLVVKRSAGDITRVTLAFLSDHAIHEHLGRIALA